VAALKPDLLVTDEVLAVGDESFQKKCVKWMKDYLDDGGTLILVSHSMYHVQKLCRHACWLRGGQVEMQGDVFDVTQAYLAWHERKSAARSESTPDQRAGLEFSVISASLNDGADERPTLIDAGEDLRIRVHVRSRDGREPCIAIGITRADGTAVYGLSTDMDGQPPQRIGADEFACELELPALALLPGGYTVRVHPLDPEGVRLFDTVERSLVVRGVSREFGLVRLAHRWNRLRDETLAP